MVHSEKDYQDALDATDILFGNATTDKLRSLSEELFLQVFAGVKKYEIQKTDIEKGIPPLELLADRTDIFPSRGEARKMILANGFSLNKQKLTDPQTPLTCSSLLNDKYMLFQKGKKSYYIIVAV